ncbi:VOC family protein [Galbitalea soli]|uniref:VOC family protein n=1 Tax=Galbitalea soli TaxID=1268042 RepID=A0A7C9TTS1_9MICO|nr:VOC family protein [Galbitalea soli]NEM92404.1 VOC family protein [Galbitalea soli]NYJ29438.1 glyoxylase I family protein [Galbitalea soli]
MQIIGVHHIAVIASDYERSKAFYTGILGFALDAEYYRAERLSWMGKLSLGGQYILELFTFPDTPPRASGPEALGLRHLAFAVADVPAARDELIARGVPCEELRTDPNTHKAMFFFRDPDGLPLEVYEA